jgi:hypothetical protein
MCGLKVETKMAFIHAACPWSFGAYNFIISQVFLVDRGAEVT